MTSSSTPRSVTPRQCSRTSQMRSTPRQRTPVVLTSSIRYRTTWLKTDLARWQRLRGANSRRSRRLLENGVLRHSRGATSGCVWSEERYDVLGPREVHRRRRTGRELDQTRERTDTVHDRKSGAHLTRRAVKADAKVVRTVEAE